MPVSTTDAIRATGLGAILLLVFVSSASIAKAPRFEGTQLVRFVLETKRIPKYRDYRRSVVAGTLTYDDKYRQPHSPPGPAPIDCARTRLIGVTYLLKRNTKSYDEPVVEYVSWTHSTVKLGKRTEKHNHQTSFEDGQNGQILTESLTLTDEMRVNGIISVRIKAGRHKVLENSFSLSQCPPISQ